MKKRILSALLAFVLIVSALPVGGKAAESGGAAAQASIRYSVSASPDQTTDVGKTVIMYVTVSGGSYNAYDLALTYDAARLTYVSGQAADKEASVTEKNGSIRVIGYGGDKSASTAVVTLTFRTKAAGTAKVVISSAKIDAGANAPTKNAPSATIRRSTTQFIVQPQFTVKLDEGLASDSLSAAAGEDYTFRATDPLHYDYKPSAKIGGKDVTVKDNGDGTYTIPGGEITGNITVKANRTPKTYKVTFKGEDLSGEKAAAYNTPYHFKLNRKAGYSYVLRVTIGGKSYTGYKAEDGGYVIPGAAITGDIVITAQKTKINSGGGSSSGGSGGGSSAKYVSVSFIGSGADDAVGKKTTRRGSEYTFRIDRKDDTDYDVSARVNGVTVKCTYDSKKDIYRIPGSAVTGDITITVTKGATVEVNAYVTLDRQSMYLVTYSGSVADGHVPMYDGQNMYWSEAYNAYAWLVVSSADEKEVVRTAQNSITIGEGEAAASIDYSGNVDLSGRIDGDDAHLDRDVYNAKYTLASMVMHKFLNADVNRDRKVDVKDAVWIVNRVLRG
mgnify:CR=1 FL=1